MRCSLICASVIALLAAGNYWAGANRSAQAAAPNQADLLKHGDYLVNNVAHCGRCHTPHNDKGEPNSTRFLQGGKLSIKPKDDTMSWAGEAPNITMTGLANRWSEEEMIKFLMTGDPPQGQKPTAPMPLYKLNQDDARAVTLYLRSLTGKKKGE